MQEIPAYTDGQLQFYVHGYEHKEAALTPSQKISPKCFSKWFCVWNANTAQVRDRFSSTTVEFLSNVGFYLFLISTRVCLLHALAVGADLAGVHAPVGLAVRVLHLLQRRFCGRSSAAVCRQKKRRFHARRASRARTQSLLFGLADTVEPLLFAEGVIGLEGVRLALRPVLEADSEEVFD